MKRFFLWKTKQSRLKTTFASLSLLVFLFIAVLVVAAQGDITVTASQRDSIHQEVDRLSAELFAAMGRQIEIDSISYGGPLGNSTAWPFEVRNIAGVSSDAYPGGNRNERDRKIRMFAEAVDTAQKLGFPVVVKRQDDKIVWAEFGDPDAPEMVMALSHLDSPTQSINTPNGEHWVNSTGALDEQAYHKYYTKTIGSDVWMYGAGIQDDSGPTVATLFAAKALMDLGLPMDRRIRIAMGGYEDSSPARPASADVVKFMNIPYYTANPGFFDNWAYKYLFREEMPVACFTSDSRFPVIVGNTQSGNRTATISLADDDGKKFALLAGDLAITDREGDDTLQWIGDGSGVQVPSKAVVALRKNGATDAETSKFITDLKSAMTTDMNGKVVITEETVGGEDCVVITINTGVAMEAPTPQYGKNALVWSMRLLSKALAEDADYAPKLQVAATTVSDNFMKDGAEDYLGKYMGLGDRIPENGCPMITIAPGYNIGKTSSAASQFFYTDSTRELKVEMYIRHMYSNAAGYSDAQDKIGTAFTSKGFSIAAAPSYSKPTLYLTHDNPLTELQFASYKNTLKGNGFEDLTALLPVSYPQATTGGTLASNYFNKMNAYGAVLPGNERWWHAANERMTQKAAVQMTKAFADCLLEMARYQGPAGAQFYMAELAGYNSDRADLDLLDVKLDTYKDARSLARSAPIPSGERLVSATNFAIEMFASRGNSAQTQDAIDAGHGAGGIYIQLTDPDYAANTFVAPMRLEFKLKRADLGVSASQWSSLKNASLKTLLGLFRFYAYNDGVLTPLDAEALGSDAEKYFYKRVSKYDKDTLYLSVNIAVADQAGSGISTSPVVSSRSDRYNPADPGLNPWPERLAATQRGFFILEDGGKDGKFSSPEAIIVTSTVASDSSVGGGGGSCNAGTGVMMALLAALILAARRSRVRTERGM